MKQTPENKESKLILNRITYEQLHFSHLSPILNEEDVDYISILAKPRRGIRSDFGLLWPPVSFSQSHSPTLSPFWLITTQLLSLWS
jgi:hypothetical protein